MAQRFREGRTSFADKLRKVRLVVAVVVVIVVAFEGLRDSEEQAFFAPSEE